MRVTSSNIPHPATRPPTAPATTRRSRKRGVRILAVAAPAALMLVVLFASAPHASAASATHTLAAAGSVSAVLSNIRNWIMGIIASVATVFLTIGGLRYVIANGDPGEVQKAKTAFKSAALGYGLAALAPLVVTVLQGIVGG
jgi:hypothetical protein